MSRWINYVDPKGRDKLITRREAVDLIASGAIAAGLKNGYECITAQQPERIWRPVSDDRQGVLSCGRNYSVGGRTLQLVPL